MTVNCAWEHNNNDTMLYSIDCVGAYTRGENLEIAKSKMSDEILSYMSWSGREFSSELDFKITEEKSSNLNIKDADSDIIFQKEKQILTIEEYIILKMLALKSANDFEDLYNSVPDKDKILKNSRKTFYGRLPITANEMYLHTKNVNEYYFSEIEVAADNSGSIYECRNRGFEELESNPKFLSNTVFEGSYGEEWSLRKVLRRFIWHDRIHAKAMYRSAVKVFGAQNVKNPFYF